MFKCEFCNKEFKRKGNLDKHVVTHTGIECQYCSYVINKDIFPSHSCIQKQLYEAKQENENLKLENATLKGNIQGTNQTIGTAISTVGTWWDIGNMCGEQRKLK